MQLLSECDEEVTATATSSTCLTSSFKILSCEQRDNRRFTRADNDLLQGGASTQGYAFTWRRRLTGTPTGTRVQTNSIAIEVLLSARRFMRYRSYCGVCLAIDVWGANEEQATLCRC
jgi:hypothetical protein